MVVRHRSEAHRRHALDLSQASTQERLHVAALTGFFSLCAALQRGPAVYEPLIIEIGYAAEWQAARQQTTSDEGAIDRFLAVVEADMQLV